MSTLWAIVNSSDVEVLLSSIDITVIDMLGVGVVQPVVTIKKYGLSDGGLFERRVWPPRDFTLVCQAPGSDLIDMHDLRQTLFELTDHGDGSPVKIRYKLNSKVFEIEASYNGGLDLAQPVNGYLSEFPLSFTAPDPFFKETTENTTSLNVNSSTAVSNGGTQDAYPILTLEGEGSIISLANSTNSKTITFDDLIIYSGETVAIDLSPGKKTVSSDVRGNLFNTVANGSDISSWVLEPGSNTVTLTAEGGDIELLITAGGNFVDIDGSGDNPLLVDSQTLNLTTTDLTHRNRHLSIDGVA